MSLYTEIIDAKVHIFSFTRVPENIPTPEVLISSLMRELKVQGISSSEKEAWGNSLELKKFLNDENNYHAEISFVHWLEIIEKFAGSMRSRDPNNKRQQYLYINPIVPEIAQYGHAARFTGNPWNPGAMLLEEIYLGCENHDEWIDLERNITETLSVSGNDDLWGFFLQNKISELSKVIKPINESKTTVIERNNYLFSSKFKERVDILNVKPTININFVKQLKELLKLKNKFSRHRWISILQSYLRFGSFMLILNKLTYSVNFIDYLMNMKEYDEKEIFKATTVKLGDKRKNLIEDRLVNYMYSNLQISLFNDSYTNSRHESIENYFNKLKDKLQHNVCNFNNINQEAMEKLHGQFKEDFRLSKNDTIKNIREFLEYVGRDRSVNNKSTKGDIEYFYTIPKNSKSYVVQFGLGLTYTLVLLAGQNTDSNNKTITANEFIEFARDFGVELSSNDFNEGPLRNSLNELGLLMESPDSELGVSIKKII